MPTATKIGKEEIKEAIKTMSMIEVAELVKDLEEEFGVSAQMPVAATAPSAAEGTEEAVAEQTEFAVILVSPGGSKIPVIKEVRAITGLTLKEAKEVVEAGGKPVKENVSKDEAEKIKKQLESAGATVELK